MLQKRVYWHYGTRRKQFFLVANVVDYKMAMTIINLVIRLPLNQLMKIK
jgi:hypothetical protein